VVRRGGLGRRTMATAKEFDRRWEEGQASGFRRDFAGESFVAADWVSGAASNRSLYVNGLPEGLAAEADSWWEGLGPVAGQGAEAWAALADYPMSAAGVPLFAPFFPDPRWNHNHSSWPFEDTFFLRTLSCAEGWPIIAGWRQRGGLRRVRRSSSFARCETIARARLRGRGLSSGRQRRSSGWTTPV